jgi:hypothetical protein
MPSHNNRHFETPGRQADRRLGADRHDAFVFIGWSAQRSQYVCAWLDVYGGVSPVSIAYADPDPDRMAFTFKDPHGSEPYARTILTRVIPGRTTR